MVEAWWSQIGDALGALVVIAAALYLFVAGDRP